MPKTIEPWPSINATLDSVSEAVRKLPAMPARIDVSRELWDALVRWADVGFEFHLEDRNPAVPPGRPGERARSGPATLLGVPVRIRDDWDGFRWWIPDMAIADLEM